MKKLILLTFILVTTLTNAFSQEGNIITAFGKSYACEYRYQYDSAMYVLKTYYTAENYEINLRMGWLSYLAGKNDQSMGYYKKAISLMPAAIEPLLGYVYPLSALEKWDDVIKQYEAILKIEPLNYLANFRLGLIYYNRKDHLVSKNSTCKGNLTSSFFISIYLILCSLVLLKRINRSDESLMLY